MSAASQLEDELNELDARHSYIVSPGASVQHFHAILDGNYPSAPLEVANRGYGIEFVLNGGCYFIWGAGVMNDEAEYVSTLPRLMIDVAASIMSPGASRVAWNRNCLELDLGEGNRMSFRSNGWCFRGPRGSVLTRYDIP